jgi:hypothetical protein
LDVQRLTAPGNGAAHHQRRARITTLVNDVEHIESQSLTNAVIGVYFSPARTFRRRSHRGAISQTFCDFCRRVPPPGKESPASTVPVIQIGLTSDTRSEQLITGKFYHQLATVPGAATPCFGKQRASLA